MITRMSRVFWNKGEMDGTTYDYTRCEIEVPIYSGSQNEFGVSTIVCEMGNEAVHTQLLQYRDKLPAVVDIEIVQVKKGKNTLNQVVGFQFIESCQIDYDKYRNQGKAAKQAQQPAS